MGKEMIGTVLKGQSWERSRKLREKGDSVFSGSVWCDGIPRKEASGLAVKVPDKQRGG